MMKPGRKDESKARKLAGSWERVQITEVCELIVDCVNKTAPHVNYETPYKMIRTPNIRNGRIDLTDCRYVTRDTFEKWTRRASVEFGDVLLTREAPMGEVGYVNFQDTVFLGQRVMQYRANQSRLLPRYLHYSFISPDLQNQFRMHDGSGSVVSHIRVPDCSKFELNLPPLSEQQRIVDILGSLDDKIEVNRAINRTLEAMAQAIFKSWFVDFDPVKAKMAARESGANPTRAAMAVISGKDDTELDAFQQQDPKSYERLRNTAEAFPDALVESELGMIPEGWGYQSAESVATVTIGKTPPRKEAEWFSESRSDVKWVSIRDMGTSGTYMLDTSECLTDAAVNKFNVKRIPDNTVLLSFKLTVGRVAITVGEMVSNEAIAHFVPKQRLGLTTEYLYHYLKQFDYETLGSTSSIARAVNSKTIKCMPILVPDFGLVDSYQDMISDLMEAIRTRQIEAKCLVDVRDTLLPQLLSGELREI